MKRVVVICDGMADEELEALGGLTPLAAAATPGMDLVAGEGTCGLVRTIPPGHYPGSETAILSILGYAPSELPAGRGPLEAGGLGLKIPDNYLAMRYRMSDASVSAEELSERYPCMEFHPLTADSGICICPEDIMPADAPDVRFWSADRPRHYEPFIKKHSGMRAALIGAVPLVEGIARESGMAWIRPYGATGDCGTDYRAKAAAAMEAIECFDAVVVHIEACDTASHLRDPYKKVEAIENIDRHIVLPLTRLCGQGVALAILPDHPALCRTGAHSDAPVPAAFLRPGRRPDGVSCYTETACMAGSLELTELWETER